MNDSVENIELNRFYHSLLQDIKSEQISREDGGTLEQLFTEWVIDLLAEAGETENARIAYDEKSLGTKNQHKINAYSISDNYETIDLFITIFNGTYDLIRVSKEDVDTSSKRILNFFRKGVYQDYVNEIEESSPIFDFAHTLCNSADLNENLVRINAIIITDGIYPGLIPKDTEISGYPIYFRIVDIDYLYNISEKTHIPIEIDFKKEGIKIPCIKSPSDNEEYLSYLAIMPGRGLSLIYERFGSRLLEQNVRSFLQFTGKINKGIRNTIINEPQMFLAYNNGITATAEELDLYQDGESVFISNVKDFQIVNGGQTTASIYHTLKKDKADISKINVQIKFSIVKNKEKFNEIVSKISEYANTQNRVSLSDLSSNRPFHIELEKLSRSIVTPHIQGKAGQTKWFYERARGQYKNARLKEGFTKSKQKVFDLKYPRNQLFTKEELAKYINSYQEIYDGKKLVVGPHFVVRGNQKNYVQFINYNIVKKMNNIYYEDIIAKAILFKSAEKTYGVKPNSIGDMRYITVSYAVAYLNYKINYEIDLFRIWKNQSVSDQLSHFIYDLMVYIEDFIKTNAPGSLYGEWAKKEECWFEIKKQDFDLNFSKIKKDLIDSNNPSKRKIITEEETATLKINEELEIIRSIPRKTWFKIEDWGTKSELLTHHQRTTAFNLAGRVRNNKTIPDSEREVGIFIINTVIQKAPELLFEIDEEENNENKIPNNKVEITIELIEKIVKWDRKNKILRPFEFKFMADLAEGKRELSKRNKEMAGWNLDKVKRNGFK